jgi:alkylation response protein AidB-like acyl-CoA dehydrogenase
VTAELRSVLAGVDTAELRASSGSMRSVLAEVVAAGGTRWTGPLAGLVSALDQVARVDLCLARLVEGHADALRIIGEAGGRPGPGLYGVWASRSAGTGLRARPAPSGWTLDGEMRFASGIGLLDRCLVPASVDTQQLLFDLDLVASARDIDVDESSWNTVAMDASRSFTVRVATRVEPQAQVGGTDFYLSRRGFPVGGLGVAAVWVGGAKQVLDAVIAGLRAFTPTPHQHRRLGEMVQAVWASDLAVSTTAAVVDGLSAGRAADEVARARTAVVLGCDSVLENAAVVVGPGGLSTSLRLSRAVADLAIYIRQHHVDRTLESLGADAAAQPDRPGS